MQELLKKIIEYARQNNIPALGDQTAQYLADLVQKKCPKNILEIGTAIGYSGILMLTKCQARLITIERNEQFVELARQNFEAAGLDSRVRIFVGDADNILPKIEGSFDFIFMDANKSRYNLYLPYCIDLLNKEGMLVCDNVLFKGRILDKSLQKRKSITITRGLESFLKNLQDDVRLITKLVEVGDGLTISTKK